MPGLNVFSDEDVRFLKKFIHLNGGRRWNSPYRFEEDPAHQAPETYIALPEQCRGIPGLTRFAGTAQGPNTGTGTSSCDTHAWPGDSPGSGLCDIYKIRVSDGTLEKVDTSVTVWNLTTADIAKDWLTVTRDKYGRWLPVMGGASNARVIFTILQVNCVDGVAMVRVLWVSKGASSPSPGSVIKVCDPCGTFFVGSQATLLGAMGFAEEFSQYNCHGEATGTGTAGANTGTGSDAPSHSDWVVYQMCGYGLSC